uniref:hypothetical protein n=1 Tax=Heyndrickxia sporothermodurans TaxID=46224 RepID=UPI0036D28968
MVNTSSNNKNPYGKLIRLLEEQLAHSNQQNKDLSKKLDQSTKQIEALTEQIRHFNKTFIWIEIRKIEIQRTRWARLII